MKAFLAAMAALCVTSQAFSQAGQPTALSRARAALALAAAPTFTVRQGFTVKRADSSQPIPPSGCPCWSWKYDENGKPIRDQYVFGPCQICGCMYGACQFDGQPHEKALAGKSAYYVAYHRAIAEHRNLMTVRPRPGWMFPMDNLEALAATTNAILVVLPDDEERVPAGLRLWRYEDGELNSYIEPAPVPVYQPAPAMAVRRFTVRGGGC